MAQTKFDVNNFVIDHVLRGTMVSPDGNVLWSLTQIKTPSLSMTSELVDATDALGSKIMTFERAKQATFTGANAIFDLSLLAAQMGTSKEYSASDHKIVTPIFDTLTISAANKSDGYVKLSKKPVAVSSGGSSVSSVAEIYKLKGDSTLGKAYSPTVSGTVATENNFYIALDSDELYFPTEMAEGEQIFVIYDYEADDTDQNGAVQVVNSASNLPKSGKFIMEVLGADVCDPFTKVYAYLILPNAKLSATTDLAFETEMTQNFEITAAQDYCTTNNTLWKLIIPEA